jgi:hypothetical protein
MILVDEARTDKSIVLTFCFDQVGIHHQPTLKFGFVESVKTYRSSYTDKNDCDAQEFGFEIRRSAMLVNLWKPFTQVHCRNDGSAIFFESREFSGRSVLEALL